MKTFMIGQHGSFSYAKFQRDWREGFYGIEACLFGQEEDAQHLLQEAAASGFRIGVHFPLRSGQSSIRDALFLAVDEELKRQAYSYAEQELDYIARVHPEYVLFHYPKPVILDTRVDWSPWSFDCEEEYLYESEIGFDQFKEQTEQWFQWLTAKSEQYAFTPVLEFDALNRYIYETDMLEELLSRYANIRLCLDTARLYLQSRIDPHFHAEHILRTYGRYADLIHLSNAQYTDRIVQRHYPALPSLRTEEGWAPIEEYLHIIKGENSGVNILFEHRSERIKDHELQACYDWIDQIMNNPSVKS